MTEAFRARVASRMLAASEAPPIVEASSCTLRYREEFRLIAGDVPGGSLNGETPTGLMGVVSANGLRLERVERADDGLAAVPRLPGAR